MKLGADVDALTDLSLSMSRAADRLDGAESEIASSLRSVAWVGPDADAARDHWYRIDSVRLRSTSIAIQAMSDELRSQAAAQRLASSGIDIVSISALFSRASNSWFGRFVEGRIQNARGNMLSNELESALSMSRDEAIAYWSGLSDEDRQLLIDIDPALALELGSPPLSPGELHLARESYVEHIADEIILREEELYASVEADIAMVHFGVDGSMALAERADGKFEVNLALEGELGLAASMAASVGGGAGVAQSYEFDSEEAAREFMDGVRDRLSPDTGDYMMGFFGGGSAVVAATADDVVGYLGEHSQNRTENRINLEAYVAAEGEFKLGGAQIELAGRGAVGGYHDLERRESAVYLEMTGGFEADVGAIEGSLESDFTVELVADEYGNVTELRYDLAVEGQVGVEVEKLLGKSFGGELDLELQAGGGGRVSVSGTLDVNDPAVEDAAAALLRGESGAVADVMRRSEALIQVGTVVDAKSEYDVGAAEVEFGVKRYDNAKTYIKPPGSGIYEYSR